MALDEIRQVRLDKLNKLKAQGINPYPAKSARTHTLLEAGDSFDALVSEVKTITIAGRVMSLRGQGALIFFDLFDGTSRFQGLFKKEDLNIDVFTLFGDTVDIGDFVEISGPVFLTKTGQKTLEVLSWTMLSKSLLPLPEKWHGLTDEEEKLRKRYLDILMNEEIADRFKKRSKFWNVIREYLLKKDFIEVETPVLENTTGGADARPFSTHHNALGMDVYLRISCGELWQKRLMVAGLPRTFEIGRIFRNEGISTEHAQDYTQLEYYMAYSDYNIGMEMTKELYRKLATEVFGKTTFSIRGHEVDFMKEWEMYDFCKIIKDNFDIDPLDETLTTDKLASKLKEVNIAVDPKELNVGRGVDLLWKSIRKTIAGPGFLTGVPAYLETLAKRSPKDTRVVERFQVILAGSEMGKGFSELNDPVDQKERFVEQQRMRDAGDDEAQMADFEYVEAMEHGMPPTFGFGLSERLFSFLLDVPIREAQIFPLMKPKEAILSKKEAEKKYRSKKFVAIANPTEGYGVTANALGQLGISIGGFCKEKIFDKEILHDKDGQIHYVDGLYPMTNLAGSQVEMAEFVRKCYEAKIQVFDFSMIMRKAHSDQEMEIGYKEVGTSEVPYIAVGALVPADFEKEFLSTLKLFS
jgi:lysyl-tRNA synthetase class 2